MPGKMVRDLGEQHGCFEFGTFSATEGHTRATTSHTVMGTRGTTAVGLGHRCMKLFCVHCAGEGRINFQPSYAWGHCLRLCLRSRVCIVPGLLGRASADSVRPNLPPFGDGHLPM